MTNCSLQIPNEQVWTTYPWEKALFIVGVEQKRYLSMSILFLRYIWFVIIFIFKKFLIALFLSNHVASLKKLYWSRFSKNGSYLFSENAYFNWCGKHFCKMNGDMCTSFYQTGVAYRISNYISIESAPTVLSSN